MTHTCRWMWSACAVVAALLLPLSSLGGSSAAAQAIDYSAILNGNFHHTCALRPSGAVECWGLNDFGQAKDQAGPYIAVAAGYRHTCALTPAGAADCWGDNNAGQADDQVGPYLAIAAGLEHTCALTVARDLDCWGRNYHDQAVDERGPFEAIDAGQYFTCVLPQGRASYWCWGQLTSGGSTQTKRDTPGPILTGSAGVRHYCVLTPKGAVDCAGDNSYGQANDWKGPFSAVSAGGNHTCTLLATGGGAVCWGDNRYGQSSFHRGPYVAIAAGWLHTCALTVARNIECWGDNHHGQATYQRGPFGPYVPPAATTAPDGAVPSADPATPTATAEEARTPEPSNDATVTPVAPAAVLGQAARLFVPWVDTGPQ